MIDHVQVRPMKPSDAAGVYRTSSEAIPATAEEREQAMNRSAEEVERRKVRYLHFLEHDPEGAWVAVVEGRVVGVALALMREGLWILSLFAVEEAYRGTGVGRRLLERVIHHGEGCRGGILASSTHPAAVRSYARAGFDLLPSLVDRTKLWQGVCPAREAFQTVSDLLLLVHRHYPTSRIREPVIEGQEPQVFESLP